MKAGKRSFWSHFRAQRQAPPTPPNGGELEPSVFWPRILQAVAASVAVALLFAVGASYDVWSQRTRQFKVRAFSVQGQQRTPVVAIRSATGLRKGSPLFGVRESDLAAKLRALPWIREAEVHIRMPGTVEISVREHEPAALLVDGGLWVLDADAHVIKPLQAQDRVEVPMLTGVAVEDLLPAPPGVFTALRGLPWVGVAARRLETAQAARSTLAHGRTQALLRLAERVLGSDLAARFELGEVAWDDVTGATLVAAKDGAELRFGHYDEDDLDRLIDQAARLIGVLQRRGERLRYALLDDPLHPDRAVVSSVPLQQSGGPVGGPRAIATPRPQGAP